MITPYLAAALKTIHTSQQAAAMIARLRIERPISEAGPSTCCEGDQGLNEWHGPIAHVVKCTMRGRAFATRGPSPSLRAIAKRLLQTANVFRIPSCRNHASDQPWHLRQAAPGRCR